MKVEFFVSRKDMDNAAMLEEAERPKGDRLDADALSAFALERKVICLKAVEDDYEQTGVILGLIFYTITRKSRKVKRITYLPGSRAEEILNALMDKVEKMDIHRTKKLKIRLPKKDSALPILARRRGYEKALRIVGFDYSAPVPQAAAMS